MTIKEKTKPKIIENKILIVKLLFASIKFLPPIYIAEIALPPVAKIKAIPVRIFIMGYTIFIAAKESVPTNVATKIPSKIVYKVLKKEVKYVGSIN